ncbi:hypothetical protein AAMO2058_001648400 [Amorphochlora amoebiformis]
MQNINTGAICCGDYGVVISVANTIRGFARQVNNGYSSNQQENTLPYKRQIE